MITVNTQIQLSPKCLTAVKIVMRYCSVTEYILSDQIIVTFGLPFLHFYQISPQTSHLLILLFSTLHLKNM